MANKSDATGNDISNEGRTPLPAREGPKGQIHPMWLDFVRFCEKLEHGEIERLRIQDGLPVLAEVAMKKVKFG